MVISVHPVFFVLTLTLFISACHCDLGTAAQLSPPYIPNSCGFDESQFPSSNLFAAAGEEIWDDGAACGRRYLVRCTSADAPEACIPSQTIQVMIVDRALTLASQPSKAEALMVLSRTAFKNIASTAAVSINIDFKQV